MTHLKHFLEKVRGIVEGSEIAHLADETPEYIPGGRSHNLTYRFSPSGESNTFSIRFSIRGDERTEVDEGTYRIDYDVKREPVIHFSAAGSMAIERAEGVLRRYGAALDIAHLIKDELLVGVYDRFREKPGPEEPDDIDRVAHEPSLLQGNKTYLKDQARDWGLKVGGTKKKLKMRLHRYAKEHGDPSKVRAYRSWKKDRYEAAFGDDEQNADYAHDLLERAAPLLDEQTFADPEEGEAYRVNGKFPAWQIEDGDLIEGLGESLNRLDGGAASDILFFEQSIVSGSCKMTPRQALQRGRIEEVKKAADRWGSHRSSS